VEQRWDPTGNGQIVPEDNKVGRKLADDAMYKLEHESGDKVKYREIPGVP
jgi:coiled-coil domain-containing protein 130